MTIADDIPKALADLGSADHLSEAVVLSTCNRVEIYACAEKFGGYQDIREFFGRHAGLAPEDVNDHLYALRDTEAIRHLFSVTAGLDSAVIGERDPRAGSHRLGALGRTRHGRLYARPALPSRGRDREAGPHRYRDRTWHRVGRPGCRRPRH